MCNENCSMYGECLDKCSRYQYTIHCVVLPQEIKIRYSILMVQNKMLRTRLFLLFHALCRINFLEAFSLPKFFLKLDRAVNIRPDLVSSSFGTVAAGANGLVTAPRSQSTAMSTIHSLFYFTFMLNFSIYSDILLNSEVQLF